MHVYSSDGVSNKARRCFDVFLMFFSVEMILYIDALFSYYSLSLFIKVPHYRINMTVHFLFFLKINAWTNSLLLKAIRPVNVNVMEYNYHNFARVPCRKRLRVQSNNRRVRASTPLVSRGTRWDPRIFECFRPRVNARVPPHRFVPSSATFSHHAIFGCSVHVTARKLKRRKWFGSRTCIVAWRALVRQPPNNRPFLHI